MSAAFTTLPTSTDPLMQDKTWANEIVRAYSERRQVIGQSAVGLLSGGESAQDKTLWRAMQEWCGTYWYAFINHADPVDPTGLVIHDGGAYPEGCLRGYTGQSYATAAGLNYDPASPQKLWRRSTDGVNFSYGYIEAGDVRGAWVFQDLQKALGVLRWTGRDGPGPWANLSEEAYREANGFAYYGENMWAELVADTQTNWDAAANSAAFHGPQAHIWSRVNYFPLRAYFEWQAAYPVIAFPAVTFGVSRSVQSYIWGTRPWSAGHSWVEYNTFDANGTGITTAWRDLGEVVSATTAAINIVLSRIAGLPQDGIYPAWVPEVIYPTEPLEMTWEKGFDAWHAEILKWNFTNA